MTDTLESVQQIVSVLMVPLVVKIDFESTSYSTAAMNGLMNGSWILAAWTKNSDTLFWSMVYVLIVLLF